ncbi:hypothetical protein [Kangiella marina]|uniref:Zinc-finger domain-containing protein n=1 Tax=Kangiella marina TaxID=1079178 RepID=A0ABP8IJH5_9GAMM
MMITDEQLCAFIDNELSSKEMDAIRDQIAQDESVADRIAELSMVDHVVSSTLHAIDEKPLPQATQDLLTGSPSTSTSNVVEMSLWRKATNTVRQHSALAAVLILTFGLTLGVFWGSNPDSNTPQWSTISQHLANNTSDQSFALDSQWHLSLKASFINKQDRYCRLFALQSSSNAHMNVACFEDNAWQLHSRTPMDATDPNSYRTASVDPETNQLIDSMIKGSFLNRSEETNAIDNNWRAQ